MQQTVVLIALISALAFGQRSFVSGNFALDLDGVKTGFVKSVDGGAISAEVINEPVGTDYVVKKHIGQPKYEDFELQLGFSMGRAVFDWISASWKQNYQRKNGSIVAFDQKLEAKSQREFFNALITETTIPACDAAGKDPAYLTVKFSPEYTRFSKASGKATLGGLGQGEQKLWQPRNFRLVIDGIDCSKVSKIDAFTVKQKIQANDVGDGRDYNREPTKLEFPNLKISLPEAAAQGFQDWHEDFVIKGNNQEEEEKTGALEFLSSNRRDVLLTIVFHNLGIYRISAEKAEANDDKVKRVNAELYCERMELKFGKGTAD